MPPTQDESKLDHLVHSDSNSTISVHSWGDENDVDTHIAVPNAENTAADEKFENILEKASMAFPKKATLETMIREAAGVGDSATEEVRILKLKVIGRDVSLQHLPIYAPKLTKLTLDESILNSLRDLGSGLSNLKYLSVNNCGLTSLDGIMALLTMEEFHAAGNRLMDLSGCVSLNEVRRINGKGNRIQDITTVSLLSFCEKLEWLDIENNLFIGDNPDYVLQIREFLPQLKKLDGIGLIPSTNIKDVTPNPKKSNGVIKAECSLPSIELPVEKVIPQRPHTTLPNCTYAVKFTPKPLSPRASSARITKSKDIQCQRFELPKL